MYYSSMGVIALLVHVIINHDVMWKRNAGNAVPTHKSYRLFLHSVMGFYVSDILWGILYDARMMTTVYIDTVLYFLAMGGALFLWTRYVIAYVDEKNSFITILNYSGYLFLISEAIALIVNIWIPSFFWFDEEKVYHAGSVRYLVLLFQIILFLATALYMLLYSSRTEGKARIRHGALGVFGLSMTLFIIIQTFFPLMPLYALGNLLGTCLLHTFVLEDEKEARRIELEELLERERKQRLELVEARQMAYTDALTGVKNKHAYVEVELELDHKIAAGELKELAVIVFDLNGLKKVNDTQGHDKGDEYIKSACKLICDVFGHSPVFRIGGDEFVALLEGEDYQNREKLIKFFEERIVENKMNGKVVISDGLEEYHPEEDNSYRSIFERADRKMYACKKMLKEGR